MNGQTLSLRRRVYNRGMRALVWLCAGLTCALLVFLIGYIFLPGNSGADLGTAVRTDQLY